MDVLMARAPPQPPGMVANAMADVVCQRAEAQESGKILRQDEGDILQVPDLFFTNACDQRL
eukprot:10311486-Lingulodinium_polyedra.AAC.1